MIKVKLEKRFKNHPKGTELEVSPRIYSLLKARGYLDKSRKRKSSKKKSSGSKSYYSYKDRMMKSSIEGTSDYPVKKSESESDDSPKSGTGEIGS